MMIAESAVGHRFFKFLLPEFCNKMSLPHAFVEQHMSSKQERCKAKAALVSPCGRTWHVELCFKNKDLYMAGEGWRQFAAAIGLSGELLVFRYRGNMVFSFRVFEPRTTCERTYTISEDDDDGSDSGSGTQEYEQDYLNPRPQPAEKTSMNRVGSPKSQGYFEVIIRPSHIRQSCTSISVKHRETSGISPEDEDMMVRDRDGRTWSIGLFHRRSRSSKGGDYVWMTKGWLKFARANGLKVGDRCKFELVQERGKKKVYLAHISRHTCE